MIYKDLKVSKELHKQLFKIKVEEEYSSIDKLIKDLLLIKIYNIKNKLNDRET